MESTADLTAETVRKVVEEEGLEARNLLNWSVPLGEKATLEGPRVSKKPPTSPRPQSASPRPPSIFGPLDLDGQTCFRRSKRCPSLGRPKSSRVRSASAGRNPEKDLRARYWAFLFDNLYRAVDEIYQTCETDESVVECKESILMLENYSKEFQALIQWLNIKRSYESTAPPNRPTSLAWEVRKSSPGKTVLRNMFIDKLMSGNSSAKRFINFDLPNGISSVAIQTESECSDSNLKPVQSTVQIPIPFDQISIENKGSEIPDYAKNGPTSSYDVGSEKFSMHNVESNGNSVPLEIPLDLSISRESPMENASSDSKPIPLLQDSLESESVTCSEMIGKCAEPKSSEKSAILDSKEASNNFLLTVVTEKTLVESATEINLSSHPTKSETQSCVVSFSCEIEDANDEKAGNYIENKANIVVTEEVEQINETIPIGFLAVPELSKQLPNDLNKNLEITILEEVCADNDVQQNVEQICSVSEEKKLIPIVDCVAKEKKVAPVVDSVAKEKLTLVADSTVSSPSKKLSQSLEVSQNSAPKKIETVPYSCDNSCQAVDSNRDKTTPSENVAKRLDVNQKLSPSKETLSHSGNNVHLAAAANPPKPVIQQKSPSTALYLGQKPARYQAINRNNISDNKRYGPYSPSLQAQQRKPYRDNQNETNIRKNTTTPGNPAFRRPYLKPVSTYSNSANLKPQASQNGKILLKDQQKNGSSSSLSSTSSGKSWADKVKGPRSETSVKVSVNQKDDENDGWETVKGRTRCRNSPAKKLMSNSDSRGCQVASVAAIQHTKIGGFPYSCNTNSLSSQKNNSLRKNGTPSPRNSSENLVSSKKVQATENSKNNKNSNKIRNSVTSRVQENEKQSEPAVKKVPLSKPTGKFPLNNEKAAIALSSKTNKVLGNRNKTMILEREKKSPKPVRRQLSADDISCTKTKKSNAPANASLKEGENITSVLNQKEHVGNCKSGKQTLANDKQQATLSVKKLAKAKSCEKKYKLIKCCSDTEVSKRSCDDQNTKLLKKSNSFDFKSDIFIDQKYDLSILNVRNADFFLKEFGMEDCLSIDLVKDSEENLYESDTGNTSDDQDGMTSQDEGSFDPAALEWYDQMMREEAQERVHKLGLSWGDQMDCFDMELRTPGRALQMHEKLSSPFRKRSLSETIRRQEEKQLKAQEQRERLLEERAQRFKDIAKKVEEMRMWKEKRQEKQRLIMEEKLQRAEEKRKRQLQKIVRKAHDEEEKVNEIAFINTLEAQNKRHDLISKEKDHEARLQDIQGERQRRLEEKAAKEAAAEERRKALEADRQARLIEMQERRKLRDQKIEQQLMEKEKERQELANQKARDREQRLSALNAAQQATLEELQKKIQLKQEESARRHEENMEQIRQKAFELSIRRCSSNNDDAPQLVPYETKKICTICNVLIGSEVYLLSHLRGKKHQEAVKDQHQGQDPSTEELELYNLKHIVDASADQLDPNIALDKERQKALKKRCKKLRQRMTNRGLEYETMLSKKLETTNSQFKNKMGRIVRDIKKCVVNEGKSPWDIHIVSSLERSLGELERLFEKCGAQDKISFRAIGGIASLLEILNLAVCISKDNLTIIPNKTVIRACMVATLASENCYDNCHYVLFGNRISIALDLLMHRLNILIPDNFCQLLYSSSGGCTPSLPVDLIGGGLMNFLSTILACLSTRESKFNGIQQMGIEQSTPNKQEEEFQQILHDVVSYIVSIGIVDKLSQYFNAVRGPINADPDVATFLLSCMSFLTALTKLFSNNYDCIFDGKKTEDSTQLFATFKVTNMVGTVSLLYGILLHSGASSRGEIPPPQLPYHTQCVTLSALQMLNHMATMDLQVVQSILGSEGLSLQLRHITSYLLWYCSHWVSDDLLHEVILLVGYFTSLNPDNQTVIQAGQRPTVLLQLCSLPFHYFSDPHLTNILFPTLIACCFRSAHNKAILEQEMSSELLSNYIEAHLLDLHQAALFPSKNKKAEKTVYEARWVFSARFPKDRWTSAKLYFSNEE